MEKVVYIGSDHAGFEAKGILADYVKAKGYEVTDLGCFSEDPCDYPDIGREIGEKVIEREGSLGIGVCGSGVGISIALNKMKGVRCALVDKAEMAKQARIHNDVNAIALGGRYTDIEEMKKIVDAFLETPFESGEERRVRRVEKLNVM